MIDSRFSFVIHVLSGGSIILFAFLVDSIVGKEFSWGWMQTLILIFGVAIIVFGFAFKKKTFSKVSANIALSILSFIVFLAVCESFFRVVEYDFSKEEKIWRSIPVFYRWPITPTGDVYFRRSGPEMWTGQVLNTRMKQLHIEPNPYGDEPIVTIAYDDKGFRNPPNFSNWDIVVAGDSFTELGYLEYDDLFTTILGNGLNLKVLNLGVSYSGPLTQLSYLQDYGISDSTKHAMIVFFEGNDLEDLNREYKSLVYWQETGQRPIRKFKKQTSVIKALYQFIFERRTSVNPIKPVDAFFNSAKGDIPVSLFYTPPNRSDISKETIHALNYFFEKYANFGEMQKIDLWMAYMPSKRRILDGQVRFAERAQEKIRQWRPSDLPEFISNLCDQYEVKFIDLTPALVEKTISKKSLVYNSIVDTHLNALGSQVVGRELVRYFSRYKSLSRALLPRP